MAFESARFRPRVASQGETLCAVTDPASSVVAIPARNRPKRRRHASRLLAADLALMPVANSDDHARRAERAKVLAARPIRQRSPFLAYLSTVMVATAIGLSVGTATVGLGSADLGTLLTSPPPPATVALVP